MNLSLSGVVAKWAGSKDPAVRFLDAAIVPSNRKSRSFITQSFGKCSWEECQRIALLLALGKTDTPVEISGARERQRKPDEDFF